jgi:hypothetical protein
VARPIGGHGHSCLESPPPAKVESRPGLHQDCPSSNPSELKTGRHVTLATSMARQEVSAPPVARPSGRSLAWTGGGKRRKGGEKRREGGEKRREGEGERRETLGSQVSAKAQIQFSSLSNPIRRCRRPTRGWPPRPRRQEAELLPCPPPCPPPSLPPCPRSRGRYASCLQILRKALPVLIWEY